jgi:TRAP-type C4-dicarboxylate transport system permease small subunit
MRTLTARLEPWFALYLVWSWRLVMWTAGAALCVAVGVNAVNIVLRYGFDKGLLWHQEVALVAAFCIYFFAYSLIAKRQTYIRVDVFLQLVPDAAQRSIDVLTRLLVIAFHATMLVLCLSAMKLIAGEVTWILELPEPLFFIPLTVGSLDILTTEVILLVRSVWGKEPQPEPGPAGV